MATQTTTVTMQPHDELAALLARNLTFGPLPIVAPMSAVEPPPKIVYSISQHYHHSAHATNPKAPVEPSQPLQPSQAESAEQLLVRNGIDPHALTAVQLALFQMSAPDRREYLLQLWRICPPAHNAVENSTDASWDAMEADTDNDVNVDTRQQQQQQQQQQQPFLQTQPATAATGTAATQSPDGRWLQSSSQNYMEPYMASGYEELARREYLASCSPRNKYADGSDNDNTQAAFGVQLRHTATDPVYANRLSTTAYPGRASWPQQHQSALEMENQYGALMAMRDACEMEM
ncbi:hypothetical protein SEPCBS119000_005973 [Sporothrix epigloea]|uniref:Uncharacterized protein n=1 Tax=Sporothrix epigloea TaxID=1892477 RepID=A0ABP0E0F9_9PEZI